MKKKILTFMIFTFCISAQAQFDGIIVVNEWETENQAKTEKLMNDWKNIISKMENAPRAFLLTEMDGNNIYFCYSFENLASYEKYDNSGRGEGEWRDMATKEFRELNGENAFEDTGTEFVMAHIYNTRADLSYVPEGMDLSVELPKNPYRRHVTMKHGWGNRVAFLENQKAQLENDKKLNNQYIYLMLEPMFGGTDGADFMMVVLGESRASYFNGLEARMKKRNNDSDWKEIQSKPIGSWIEEESLMVKY
jgi:hypothetical protein